MNSVCDGVLKTVTDKVKINGLYVEAVIGVYQWEHEEPQPLILDLTLGTCFDEVFNSDHLEHTLDYAAITKNIKMLCKENRYQLIEGLASAILTRLFNDYPVIDVHLSISKPHALSNAVASIECYRTRQEFYDNKSIS